MKSARALTDRPELNKSKNLNFQGVTAWLSQLPRTNAQSKSPKLENKVQKFIFHLTSILTFLFPRTGAKFLDSLVLPILGHRLLVKGIFRRNSRIVKNLRLVQRILVIPDIHIGDAIMMQGAVQAFRDFFPSARIDYVVKKSAASLIIGNPAISHVYPRFVGTSFPTSDDIQCLQELVAENHYDLCFNASSFFDDAKLFSRGQVFLNFMTVAPQLMRNESDRTGNNHFLHQSYTFVEKLLLDNGFTRGSKRFGGVQVTLSDEAIQQARAFLEADGVPANKPILFLNPDTASPYTLIPFHYQAKILKEWLKLDCSVLLGASFTHADMSERLLEILSPEEKKMVFQTPHGLPMEAYAALTDTADVFLSGDTGPLHMAAARKVSRSGKLKFKNKTFVISVFGATPARMSGYDSADPLYLPANQDAPSKTYVSESPCRNITCVNKMLKTCEIPRCFEFLDIEGMMVDIQLYLKNQTKIVPLLVS